MSSSHSLESCQSRLHSLTLNRSNTLLLYVVFYLCFDESCVVILSGCLSFSPSAILFHLPTYHVLTGWEVGACRTTRWTNWRVDRMTDMVGVFYISMQAKHVYLLFVGSHVNKDSFGEQ